MGSMLSVIIELIVSLLLVVTISYCFVVNRKLAALRTDQSGLRQVVGELNRSTERAEKAIVEMRRTAHSVEGEMASHFEAARQVSTELKDQLDRNKNLKVLADKLSSLELDQLQDMVRSNEQRGQSRQMKLARELKRQKLGFSRDNFQTATPLNEQSLRREGNG